jgi:hypothetical protein
MDEWKSDSLLRDGPKPNR